MEGRVTPLPGRADGTSVCVVGGGIGGLSTACYLADAGADVTVLEKNESLGGRATVLERDGFRWDLGPSWYLMPDVFERFFDHFDRAPSDFYDLEHLDPHYRICFKEPEADGGPSVDDGVPVVDGGRESAPPTGSGVSDPSLDATGDDRSSGPVGTGEFVDVTGDLDEMKRLFESYETGAGDALERYLAESQDAYEVGMEHFVYTDRGDFRDYIDLDVLRNARGLGLLGSMHDHVRDYFDHPKLRQIVQYSLVFLGGSPRNTPAIYKLMSHVDFGLGVHYPSGGLYAVVEALATLGESLGVRYETDAPVTSIRGRRGDFDVAIDGEAGHAATPERTYSADVVVSDAEYAYTERELLRPQDRQYDDEYWTDRTLAPSAYLLYLGVEGDVDPLEHHTLVLPEDWDPHFERIFDEPEWPEEPAYYCCVPSETDPTVAPPDHSTLFLLCPIAPGLDDGPDVRAEMRERLLADLATNAGVDVRDRIVAEEEFTVSEFTERYNATQGTALGLAHTLRQTGPLRPDHRSDALDGLYFTGAFTRPGIGVPMCLIGGEHAAGAVVEDLGDA